MPEGRAGQAGAGGGRRDEGQGQRVEAQGDELRADVGARKRQVGTQFGGSLAARARSQTRRRLALRDGQSGESCRGAGAAGESVEEDTEAKAALEAEAEAGAGRRQDPGRAEPEDRSRGTLQDRVEDPEDPDGFIQGYNAQVAVDAQCQIIVSQHVTPATGDVNQLERAVSSIQRTLRRKPRAVLADAGYWSESNARRWRGRRSPPSSPQALEAQRSSRTGSSRPASRQSLRAPKDGTQAGNPPGQEDVRETKTNRGTCLR